MDKFNEALDEYAAEVVDRVMSDEGYVPACVPGAEDEARARVVAYVDRLERENVAWGETWKHECALRRTEVDYLKAEVERLAAKLAAERQRAEGLREALERIVAYNGISVSHTGNIARAALEKP